MLHWLLCLALVAPFADRTHPSPPAGRTPQVSARADASAPTLPWEPDSSSELLAASHVFAVTLREIVPSPWLAQPDGLEQRELAMRVRLDAVLKGEVRAARGEEFSVTVTQVREPGGIVSDFHGFWSDADPQTGASYLVLATGRSGDPATLMQEPAIRLLVPAALQPDVAFATTAEQQMAGRLGAATTRDQALLDLLKRTDEGRQTLGLLAATYVDARAAGGDLRGGPLADAILAIVLARDTAPGLRSVLATGLANAALDQSAEPAQRAAIAKGLFSVAAVDAELFERLATAELYNLIFEMDDPVLDAADVVGDRAERARLAALLADFDDERADAIAAWLRRG